MEKIGVFFERLDAVLNPFDNKTAAAVHTLAEEIINVECGFNEDSEVKSRLLADVTEFYEELIQKVGEDINKMGAGEKKAFYNNFRLFLAESKDMGPALADFFSAVFGKFVPEIDYILATETEGEQVKESFKREYRYPFKLPDLQCTHEDIRRFLAKCDLEVDEMQGKGGHTTIKDPLGEVENETLSRSEKLWLANIVKALYNKGLSLERIIKACKKCKINIKVLS